MRCGWRMLTMQVNASSLCLVSHAEIGYVPAIHFKTSEGCSCLSSIFWSRAHCHCVNHIVFSSYIFFGLSPIWVRLIQFSISMFYSLVHLLYIFTHFSYISFLITSLHLSFGLPIFRCLHTSMFSFLHSQHIA